MLLKTMSVAAVLALALAGGAAAANEPAAPSVMDHGVDAAAISYGRQSLLEPVREARSLGGSPASALVDCASEPLAAERAAGTQAFACYALPQWPVTGTTESFEEGQRRKFEGQ